jgi:superfamily I DNA/RNA helicase
LAVGPKAVNVWTGTFHAFGLDTIRKHHALFGVSEDPRIVDASESVAMLEEALPALEMKHFLNLLEPALALRDILRAISRAKDELWSWEDYQRAAAAMGASARSEDERVTAEKAGEVAVVYEHYQKQLIADGAVDYGDLIMRPTMMMRGDRDFRDAMRSKFTHVHIDEYQDVNRASAMMVREIVGDGENLWAVGDARQSIYRFRGASAANIAKFETDYPKGLRDGLEVNYRSTKEIVDLYSGFGGTMKVRTFAGAADLRAEKGAGGERPTVFQGTDATDEMDLLAGSVRELEASGTALRDQAVLARSNGSLARFAEEMEARGIPVLYLGPLFERSEVRDLLSILSLIADEHGTGLVRIAELPEYKVPIEDTLRVLGLAKTAEERIFDYLRKVEGVEELSPAGRAGLLRLAQHLQGISQGTTAWLALSRFLFDRSDYIRTVLSGQTPSDELRRVAVRQLLDLLRNMPSHGRGSPIRRALNRIRHMILLSDERDLRHLPPELDGLNGVRLMTVHASKRSRIRSRASSGPIRRGIAGGEPAVGLPATDRHGRYGRRRRARGGGGMHLLRRDVPGEVASAPLPPDQPQRKKRESIPFSRAPRCAAGRSDRRDRTHQPHEDLRPHPDASGSGRTVRRRHRTLYRLSATLLLRVGASIIPSFANRRLSRRARLPAKGPKIRSRTAAGRHVRPCRGGGGLRASVDGQQARGAPFRSRLPQAHDGDAQPPASIERRRGER